MIALVYPTTGPTPFTDELRKYVDEGGSQVRQTDGCEGILYLADPTTGEGFGINLFRDQAAVDAFQAVAERLAKGAEQDFGIGVGEPHVYEVLARL
jgi:hypothetical protein